VTVADLVAFHRTLVGGRLLGDELTASALTPHVLHSRRSGLRLMMGYGFELGVGNDDRVRYYQKDGANVGVSALLRHYPDHDLTLAILGVGEDAIREPVAAFDAGVPSSEPT
jgi:hypothetical protein